MNKHKSSLIFFALLSFLFCQSIIAKETKYPIPKKDVERIEKAAILAEKATICRLDWKDYYLSFMQNERTKNWTQKQIAFIGAYFGGIQGFYSKELKSKKYSPSDIKIILKEMKKYQKKIKKN